MSAIEKNHLRIELKKWERFFFKVNARKPTHQDILTAGDDVLNLYKKYWKIHKKSTQLCNQDDHLVQTEQPATAKSDLQSSLSLKQPTTPSDINKNGDPELSIWNTSLLQAAKAIKDLRSNSVCEPFLKNLNKNYSRKEFVKKTIFKKRKKRKEGTFPPHEIILNKAEDGIIESNVISLSQLNIVSEISKTDLPPATVSSQSSSLDPESPTPPSSSSSSSESEKEEPFEGCSLPVNNEPNGRKRKVRPINKGYKDNFVKIDLRKKSYASKGYRKINVKRVKREAYYRKAKKK